MNTADMNRENIGPSAYSAPGKGKKVAGSKQSGVERQVGHLPLQERIALIEQACIKYPRWVAIRDEIAMCHSMNTNAAEPQCLMLVGPTGAGKTTLTEGYCKQYPPVYTETGVLRTVVQVTIPSPATIGNLATALLYALGDPRAESGTIGAKTHRIMNFFKDCKVEMLLVDEIQHFVDMDSQKVLINVTNWLKTLLKETKVACILVGLQGEAEQVLRVNPQLARLFGDPRVLSPFEWDDARPETKKEFRQLLKEIDKLLPLPTLSHLGDVDTAWRCFVASRGSISYLMALVRRACYLAITQGAQQIDITLLALAFDQRLASGIRGIPNPFVGEAPAALPPEPTPVPLVPVDNRRRPRIGKGQSPGNGVAGFLN